MVKDGRDAVAHQIQAQPTPAVTVGFVPGCIPDLWEVSDRQVLNWASLLGKATVRGIIRFVCRVSSDMWCEAYCRSLALQTRDPSRILSRLAMPGLSARLANPCFEKGTSSGSARRSAASTVAGHHFLRRTAKISFEKQLGQLAEGAMEIMVMGGAWEIGCEIAFRLVHCEEVEAFGIVDPPADALEARQA